MVTTFFFLCHSYLMLGWCSCIHKSLPGVKQDPATRGVRMMIFLFLFLLPIFFVFSNAMPTVQLLSPADINMQGQDDDYEQVDDDYEEEDERLLNEHLLAEDELHSVFQGMEEDFQIYASHCNSWGLRRQRSSLRRESRVWRSTCSGRMVCATTGKENPFTTVYSNSECLKLIYYYYYYYFFFVLLAFVA